MDDNHPYLISSVPWTDDEGNSRKRVVLDIPDSMNEEFLKVWESLTENKVDKKLKK